MPKTTGLTPKEERFVAEYLIDANATRAALAAGYSERTADRIGSHVLARQRVKAAIRKALAEQQKRTLIKADQVLLDINAIADQARKAGEFSAAIRGKELIGKHYKLFTDQLEVKDTTPRAERLARARERLQKKAGQ